MTPPAHAERYKNHRFPGEIISPKFLPLKKRILLR